jgi:hypothetical protein
MQLSGRLSLGEENHLNGSYETKIWILEEVPTVLVHAKFIQLNKAGDRNKIPKCITNLLEQVSATRRFSILFQRECLMRIFGFKI